MLVKMSSVAIVVIADAPKQPRPSRVQRASLPLLLFALDGESTQAVSARGRHRSYTAGIFSSRQSRSYASHLHRASVAHTVAADALPQPAPSGLHDQSLPLLATTAASHPLITSHTSVPHYTIMRYNLIHFDCSYVLCSLCFHGQGQARPRLTAFAALGL